MSNFKLTRVTYIIPTGCVGNNSVSLWKSLCCSPGLMWCREVCHTLFCSWYIPRCSDMDVFSEYFTAFASFVGASVTLKNLSDFPKYLHFCSLLIRELKPQVFVNFNNSVASHFTSKSKFIQEEPEKWRPWTSNLCWTLGQFREQKRGTCLCRERGWGWERL